MSSLDRFSCRQQNHEGTGWPGPKSLTITLAQPSQTGVWGHVFSSCPFGNGFPMEYLQNVYSLIRLGYVWLLKTSHSSPVAELGVCHSLSFTLCPPPHPFHKHPLEAYIQPWFHTQVTNFGEPPCGSYYLSVMMAPSPPQLITLHFK